MRKINMTMTKSWLGVGALCAMLAVGACTPNGNSGGGTSAQPQPYQQPQPYPQQTAPHTERGMTAPVILNLRGPMPAPSAGPITLDLEIVVNEPIQAPVSLQVQLPPGVQLVSGMPSEMLNLPQPGKLYRQYVVQSPGPLNQPVIVTAQARGPNDAWGFSARKQYPPAMDNLPPHPRSPGVGRPPAVRP
jgi:hypothetical protein